MTTSPPKLISVEELMRLSARHYRVEVVNGELRIKDADDMSPGFMHALVIKRLYDLLNPFVNSQRLGYVFSDGLSYFLDTDSMSVRHSRIPDLSFIRAGRIPKDYDLSRPFPGAPDLAVEVVSPTEPGTEIEEKLEDLLRYGAKQAWVIYPERRSMLQHFPDGRAHRYVSEDVIDVDALLPGLVLKLADLFVLPELGA
jgi:Uma2 family endonuclease